MVGAHSEVRMSSSRIGIRRGRQLIGVLGLALACGLTSASAADTHSSPEDRARFVSITRSLEDAPLNPNLTADRAWALSWLTDAPDVSVNVCLASLGDMAQGKYPYDSQIVLQYTFSMAALVIEHPETVNDPNAQQLAGAEGALNAYRAILKDKPDAKSPELEALLETRTRGELSDFVRKAAVHCSGK
jgi:hypothetical protein